MRRVSRHAAHAAGRRLGALVLAPDGRSLLARTPGDGAALLDFDTGQVRALLDPPERRSGSWAFTPDGRAAITVSYDRTLRVCDVATGATTWTFECPAAEGAGGYRPQLSYGDGSDAVWQYASGDAGPRDVSVAPDGRTAFTAAPGARRGVVGRRVARGAVEHRDG